MQNGAGTERSIVREWVPDHGFPVPTDGARDVGSLVVLLPIPVDFDQPKIGFEQTIRQPVRFHK